MNAKPGRAELRTEFAFDIDISLPNYLANLVNSLATVRTPVDAAQTSSGADTPRYSSLQADNPHIAAAPHPPRHSKRSDQARTHGWQHCGRHQRHTRTPAHAVVAHKADR